MRVFAITILLASALGCQHLQLGNECAKICGPDHFKCSIGRPDEPRGAKLDIPATESSQAINFSVRYSGVICQFSYVNHVQPNLNFTIGIAEEPAPPAEEGKSLDELPRHEGEQ